MLSLREVYEQKCEVLGCKKNSLLHRMLPSEPGEYDGVKELDLSINFVGPRGLVALLEVARACTSLRSLDLRENQLTNKSVEDIVQYCTAHRTLTSLDVSNNPITLAGGKLLLELAQNNANILFVGAKGTNIRPMLERSIELATENNRIRKERDNPWQLQNTHSTPLQGQIAGAIRSVNLSQAGSPAAAHREEVPKAGSVPAMWGEGMVLEMETTKNLLSALPHTIHPILFDANPVDALATLCSQHEAQFQDPQFPPEARSLAADPSASYKVARWARVGDICKLPVLFGEQAGGRNVVGGLSLGQAESSWVLASLSEIVRHTGGDRVIRHLFYPQKLHACGVYSVRFYINGKWRFVVVDDFIPCGEDGLPAFMSPKKGSEVWVLLLEKALAKLHACYESLDHGSSSQRAPQQGKHRRSSPATFLMDVTAGVGISRDLTHSEFDPDQFWETFCDVIGRGAMAVAQCDGLDVQGKVDVGLVPNHSYTVRSVKLVNGFRLVCLCGEWAREARSRWWGKGPQEGADKAPLWTGEWSPQSELWTRYPEVGAAVAGVLEPEEEKDGFWMTYNQFLQYFGSIHLNRTFNNQHTVLVEGRWGGETAGGPHFAPNWCLNPRYQVSVDQGGVFFFHLTLPDERFAQEEPEADTLGFHLVSSTYYPLMYDTDSITFKTGYYISTSVTHEGYVDSGPYWFIPSTYTAGQKGPFMVRIFSESPFRVVNQQLGNYWQEQIQETGWPSTGSGEYQSGDDNLQFELIVPTPIVDEEGEMGSSMQQVVMTMKVKPDPADALNDHEDVERAIVMFVCLSDPTIKTVTGATERLLGRIDDDSILQKSRYIISDTVSLKTALPSGTYIISCGMTPPRSRSLCTLSCWCTAAGFSVRELPVWNKKMVDAEWVSAGVFKCGDGHPQFELVPAVPMRATVTVSVTRCNAPAIAFFIVDNSVAPGKALRGEIPDRRVILSSAYVKGDTVTEQFSIPNPSLLSSYLIIPCLQPPGAKASCTVTISASSDDYQFYQIV